MDSRSSVKAQLPRPALRSADDFCERRRLLADREMLVVLSGMSEVRRGRMADGSAQEARGALLSPRTTQHLNNVTVDDRVVPVLRVLLDRFLVLVQRDPPPGLVEVEVA